jgi:hypothetical protein
MLRDLHGWDYRHAQVSPKYVKTILRVPGAKELKTAAAICSDVTNSAASWWADMAPEDPAREQVLHRDRVQRPLIGVDLRDVPSPQHIRCRRGEVAAHQVTRGRLSAWTSQ